MQEFQPGRIVATIAAISTLERSGESIFRFLSRHIQGNWGDALPPEDATANERALKDGSRLLSAYQLATGQKLWIITDSEEDGVRFATTVLLPSDY